MAFFRVLFAALVGVAGIFASGWGHAAHYQTQKTGVDQVLKEGDSYEYTPEGFRLVLKKIHVHMTKCAVPGFNCGGAYTGRPTVTPEFEILRRKDCDARIIPDSCSAEHRAEALPDGKSVRVRFLRFNEVCDPKDNPSNYESCLHRVIINSHDRPPRDPRHCDLIPSPFLRDGCIEFIADKLGDPKICELMKGPLGFKCVFLKAKEKKNPEICRTLVRGPQHHREQDWKDQIEACLNSVGR